MARGPDKPARATGDQGKGTRHDEREPRRHARTHADQPSGAWANSLRPPGPGRDVTTAPEFTSGATLARPDRQRPEPLWHQVEQSVRAAIDGGSWRSGARIPGEDELTKVLGVSRITVRHALSNLQSAGVLRREHGRGTFVRSARLVADTRALMSFSQEMAALGLDTGTRVLDVSWDTASDRVAEALEVAETTAVVRVRRLRFGGGQAIGVQTAHLGGDRVDGLSSVNIGDGSLYQLLRDRYALYPVLAQELYRVGVAGTAEAELLGIAAGDAVFVVERITSDERGPFEYTTSTMHGDRYEIRSTLHAP